PFFRTYPMDLLLFSHLMKQYNRFAIHLLSKDRSFLAQMIVKSIYVYRVTNHRVKGTKDVKQDPVYLGKEITVDGKTVIQEPKRRMKVRSIVESAPYIMYRYAENSGIIDDFIPAIEGLTDMRGAARRIVEISAMDMFGSTGSMELHTGIKDGTVKESHDLVDFGGLETRKKRMLSSYYY
ncbi:MAG: hypothetical protein ACYDCP_03085, partial [Thermoplasmataceae archaeon]